MSNEKKEFYGLNYDPVFKNVFYRDKSLLKRFLNDILSNFYDNLIINDVSILNTEIPKDRLYIKNKTVDILVDIGDKKINCEVNMSYDNETEFRNFLYLMQATIHDVKQGTNYVDIDDRIQLNINFVGNKAQGFEISEYTNITTGIRKIPYVRTIDINVDYFRNTWYNLVGIEKEKYYEDNKSIIMFSFNENDLKNLKDEDEYMKKIKNDVEELNQDSEFYQWMTDEEDRQMMENSIKIRCRREGIEEGRSESIKEIARNLKKLGTSISDISKATGLSEKEIEEL